MAYHLHRLAGAAEIIGANAIAHQCRDLENACDGMTPPEVATILLYLQTLLTDLAAR
ncbi:Hpt domain-containing protein [Enterobacter cloacae]|uniref:Hpt domain-containing protein n=1 Tax=Enterobacter cloacae TaxID=550 RepID=UPI0033093A48|nr:Hpt domain-containing protein [Enterobacter asburiae]HDR2800147.1 Hpt domain-containing protein [Enterobacter asburiae]